MKVSICFKTGEELTFDNVKQVFVNVNDDEIRLAFGPFNSENFCSCDINFYDILN